MSLYALFFFSCTKRIKEPKLVILASLAYEWLYKRKPGFKKERLGNEENKGLKLILHNLGKECKCRLVLDKNEEWSKKKVLGHLGELWSSKFHVEAWERCF